MISTDPSPDEACLDVMLYLLKVSIALVGPLRRGFASVMRGEDGLGVLRVAVLASLDILEGIMLAECREQSTIGLVGYSLLLRWW